MTPAIGPLSASVYTGGNTGRGGHRRRGVGERGATGGGFPAQCRVPTPVNVVRQNIEAVELFVAARTGEPYRMPTPTLKRRLQRLEASVLRENELAPDRCRFITRAAVEHLSTDQLRSALGAKAALQEGREPTSQEFAAVRALTTATEVECRRAGMTVAEFNRNLAAASARRNQIGRTNGEN
jgi:hypothetical protein